MCLLRQQQLRFAARSADAAFSHVRLAVQSIKNECCSNAGFRNRDATHTHQAADYLMRSNHAPPGDPCSSSRSSPINRLMHQHSRPATPLPTPNAEKRRALAPPWKPLQENKGRPTPRCQPDTCTWHNYCTIWQIAKGFASQSNRKGPLRRQRPVFGRWQLADFPLQLAAGEFISPRQIRPLLRFPA